MTRRAAEVENILIHPVLRFLQFTKFGLSQLPPALDDRFSSNVPYDRRTYSQSSVSTNLEVSKWAPRSLSPPVVSRNVATTYDRECEEGVGVLASRFPPSTGAVYM